MGRRLVVATLALVVSVALAPLPGLTHTSGSPSEWRPGCGFYLAGRPFGFGHTFCDDTWHARFLVDYNHLVVGRSGVHVTIFDGSGGHRLWGWHGDDFSKLEPAGEPRRRGTGARLDPYEIDVPVAAGDPRQLVVHQYARYRNKTNEVEMAWDVVNVTDDPVSYRLTVAIEAATVCAHGEIRHNPREIGTYLRDEEPPELNECEFIWSDLGRALYLRQHADSPWSAYQHSTYGDVEERLRAGRSLANTHSPGMTWSPTLAVEWDDHGPGGTPLPPGATAHYSTSLRFHTSLGSWPFLHVSKRRRVPLRLTTEWARGGPLRNHRIGLLIRDEEEHSRIRFVRTDERGVARTAVRVSEKYRTEYVTLFFDANGDERFQRERELSRGTLMLEWDPDYERHYWERFGGSLTFGRAGDEFSGTVSARVRRKETPTKGPVDCRSERVVVIRRERRGADQTIASAITDRRGRWDLTVDAPAGRYYGLLLREERVYYPTENLSYLCRGARST